MGRLLRRTGVGVLLAALLALTEMLGGAAPARAQFSEASAPAAELPAGQTVNLFARWEGGEAIDGLFIELPAGWRLEEAVVLRYGAQRVPVSVRESRGGGGAYFVGVGRTLRGPHQFVFRVRTGGAATGAATWTLTPFTYRAQDKLRRLTRYRTRRRATLKRTAKVDGNRVLSFQRQARPLLLRRAALPSLSTASAYTVEAWINTTRLDEVVLSTWNGIEQQPYPLELVVDPAGRLRFYRGHPGRHTSMSSTQPVADGTWHYMAVVHDPEDARTRLFLDGAPVDSLRDAASLETDLESVALGGRVPPARRQEDDVPQINGFSGQLDEVYFRPEARTARAVQRAMHQPRPSSAPGFSVSSAVGEQGQRPVLLSFDEDWPDPSLLQDSKKPTGVQRVRSTLRFFVPISELGATTDKQTVSLSWKAEDRGTFVIERSTDGTRFRPVGRRRAREGRQRYAFTDSHPTGEVLFYRVRQHFDDGAERVSSALKVGRGTTQKKAGPALFGNFPNPFSQATTISYKVVEEDTPVRLSVWSLTGQRLATLVNEPQGPGYHEVRYQPDDLSSGTYLIRLRVGAEQKTHKMVLVK